MCAVSNKLECQFNIYFYVRHDSKSSSEEDDVKASFLSDDAASPVCITSFIEDKVSSHTICLLNYSF